MFSWEGILLSLGACATAKAMNFPTQTITDSKKGGRIKPVPGISEVVRNDL